jgi:hypothetical protein
MITSLAGAMAKDFEDTNERNRREHQAMTGNAGNAAGVLKPEARGVLRELVRERFKFKFPEDNSGVWQGMCSCEHSLAHLL